MFKATDENRSEHDPMHWKSAVKYSPFYNKIKQHDYVNQWHRWAEYTTPDMLEDLAPFLIIGLTLECLESLNDGRSAGDEYEELAGKHRDAFESLAWTESRFAFLFLCRAG